MNKFISRAFDWLVRNFSSLMLSLLMALFVWGSAVMAADPNETRQYPQPVDLELFGLNSSLVIVNQVPESILLTITAPRSIWNKLEGDPTLLRAWVDLTGLKTGQYTLPVKTQIAITPNQIKLVDPGEILVDLEPLTVKSVPVQLVSLGEPDIGYSKGVIKSDLAQVTLSGPTTIVEKVTRVVANIDVTSASDKVQKNVTLIALDQNGENVKGVTITPQTITVMQDITLLGGYRNVVVKVVTSGQVMEGYWLTNVSVTPPNVIVFSANPELVNSLPGYVETEKVDLDSLTDDVDIRVNLNLPDGVELAGEESVLVRLSIASQEGSLPISLPIVVTGLSPEYSVKVSPDKVDLLIIGPLPILNNLKPSGIRVSINLKDLGLGTHKVKPIVDLLPNQVHIASILPDLVEVVITPANVPLITLTPTPVNTTSPNP
jgi:YbbR domain-containing protein